MIISDFLRVRPKYAFSKDKSTERTTTVSQHGVKSTDSRMELKKLYPRFMAISHVVLGTPLPLVPHFFLVYMMHI